MNPVFGLLVLGHLIGDFFFQPDVMAEQKGKSIKMFGMHCGVYSACMLFVCLFLFDGVSNIVVAWICLSVTHFLIDAITRKLSPRSSKSAQKTISVFCIDQALHIVVCFIVSAFVPSNLGTLNALSEAYLPIPSDESISVLAAFGLILPLVASWAPAAITMREFLASVADAAATKEADAGNERQLLGASEIRAGKWIGMLERSIVVVMTFFGQYSAIAFVFTAKSIARYEQLKKKDFAERYLVGTFASVAFAIIATLVSVALF